MHRSSSKSGVALAPVSRGPDACQMITRAQLGQDPPQRTVLGVLTENGQYGRTCGQVMSDKGHHVMVGGGFLLESDLEYPGVLQPWNLDCRDTDFGPLFQLERVNNLLFFQ